MSKLLKLIIMGAPGSGKGTISKRIVNYLNLKLLSSGDLLRKEIASKTGLGRECEEFIKKGKLVPDKLVEEILFHKLNNFSDGWLLDGYPRTVDQAKALFDHGHNPDLVIDLQVPFEEIIRRLKDRWVHIPSGRVYNLQFNSPKVSGRDDETGDVLVQREDDMPETVLTRLSHYEEATIPVNEFFRKEKKLVTFHGTESDVIWPEIRERLSIFKNRAALRS